MLKKKKSWFKLRFYPHIGVRLRSSDKNSVGRYIHNPTKISNHNFKPLIHKTITEVGYRRKKNKDGSSSSLRTLKKKQREIFYANHFDSAIYAFYALKLQKNYEKILFEAGLNDCVTAYRRIQHPSLRRNKCNVDFALEIFSFIKNYEGDEIVALAFDIKDFFPSLNHKNLKKKWVEVMCFDRSLPEDHYNVFKNVTKFSYINEKEIFNLFKDQIIVERKIDGARVTKKKLVPNQAFMKNRKAIAYCENKSDIAKIRRAGLIKSNKLVSKNGPRRLSGIPQGTPISATLANIYLLDFDLSLKEYVDGINGLYRRYSDDIVVLCLPNDVQNTIQKVNELISSKEVLLQIQNSKNQATHFIRSRRLNKFESYRLNLETGELTPKKMFQYLGFEFDGHGTYIRQASISKFYRRMKRGINRGVFFAKRMRNSTRGKIFKTALRKKHTLIGGKRRLVWRINPSTGKSQRTKTWNWGNYLTYTNLAAKTMGGSNIRNQLKQHWNIFDNEIKKAEEEIKKS